MREQLGITSFCVLCFLRGPGLVDYEEPPSRTYWLGLFFTYVISLSVIRKAAVDSYHGLSTKHPLRYARKAATVFVSVVIFLLTIPHGISVRPPRVPIRGFFNPHNWQKFF